MTLIFVPFQIKQITKNPIAAINGELDSIPMNQSYFMISTNWKDAYKCLPPQSLCYQNYNYKNSSQQESFSAFSNFTWFNPWNQMGMISAINNQYYWISWSCSSTIVCDILCIFYLQKKGDYIVELFIETSYNILLGRPWIHAQNIVASTPH